MEAIYPEEKVKEFLRESNEIEGIYTNLSDSVCAYEYIITQEELTLPIILKCHKLIMQNLTPNIAGKLRDYEVSVGGRAGYPAYSLKENLNKWIRNANSNFIKAEEKDIKENHIWFEFIHPFEDGNGRVGRLIYLWQRLKAGLPMHIIYADKKQFYYQWFRDPLMAIAYTYHK